MKRLGGLGLALLAVGCNSQDADCLAKLGSRLSQAARILVSTNQQRLWDKVPACRGADDVETRVARRLKWDKSLADLSIQVRPLESGVELRGQVPSEELRRRALELAEWTLGVEHVRDLLEVSSQRPEESGSKQ
jgi:osmotically-inducible protein OsmY